MCLPPSLQTSGSPSQVHVYRYYGTGAGAALQGRNASQESKELNFFFTNALGKELLTKPRGQAKACSQVCFAFLLAESKQSGLKE